MSIIAHKKLNTFSKNKSQRALNIVKKTLQVEADAIHALKNRIANDVNQPLIHAINILLECKGHVIISGIGKSGHIGRKIAATFSSTGTPALFIHPVEAAHGDLGIVTNNDVFIAISNSGETAELIRIIPVIKRMGVKLISMTGNEKSNLAKLALIHLNVGVTKEACTLNLAPTASTITTLAMGDALAVSLLDARGFLQKDFVRSHPGGILSQRLLIHVRDIMRISKAIPVVTQDVSLFTTLIEMTKKNMAMTAVVNNIFHPIGVFTDGDLRRLLATHNKNFNKFLISDVMNRNPHTIFPDQLAIDAIQIIKKFCINQLLVIDMHGKLIGALHIHDLTNAKII